jgi:hypothetical protein
VLWRHAKVNGIDADTLARLPLIDPAGLHPLVLPDGSRAALDRRVRATDRCTRQAGTHKRRIKDLSASCCPRERCFRQVDPGGLARSLGGLARSLGGLAEIGGPALVAAMGPPAASPNASKFRAFTGLGPRPPRPARLTGKASRSARLATGCCAPP